MSRKKKLIICLSVIVAVAFVAGITTIASSSYGTESDPLVALSYLDSTVTPEILSQVQDLINSGGTGSASGEEFSVVSLSNGQTLSCSVGTEIMLRIGTAVSAGSDSPRLIDETDGTAVSSSGTSLTTNHMYMVTISGNGIKATSSAKIVIRGSYTIS